MAHKLMSHEPKREDVAISVSIDLAGEPKEVFDSFVLNLTDSLEREGLEFRPGPGGEVTEQSEKVGQVVSWKPPTDIEIEWKTGAKWDSHDKNRLTLVFKPISETKKKQTNVTVRLQGWGRLVGDEGPMLSEWFADEVATNLLKATSPKRFTSWITDKRARKPSGETARTSYRDPLFHRPSFKAVLHYLNLKKGDHLLEVGCGGGAFLFDALKSGCSAAAIDHSGDMVKVASELNAQAISEKRLEIAKAEAESIPYPDETFSCAASANVFGFIDDPVRVLSEINRVLKHGGRLVLTMGSKESKGTIASPYPIAFHLHFYSAKELSGLARKAGFERARVERPDLAPFAREANLRKDMVKVFHGKDSLFLLANKN